MSTARFLVGDVFERLKEIPDSSVDLVMTSPPFLALRSYLPAGHPDKAKEIGSEATPAEFIDTLLHLTAEWGRVLAPHGSICVELGDTYAGSGGAGGDWIEGSGQRVYKRGDDIPDFSTMPQRKGNGWPLDKSLTGIPTLYAWSLAYGRNLLTGQPSPAGQWRIRNLVAWVRPNPPVGALGDKFRPATSYLTIATRARNRYFDLDAVRTPAQVRMGREVAGNNVKGSDEQSHRFDKRVDSNPAGAPPLDWWNIPTQPYKGAHYAAYPPALCTRPILAMTPPKVCTTCGEPSRRIVDTSYEAHGDPAKQNAEHKASADYTGQQRNENAQGMAHGRATKHVETVGWSDCGHDTWRPGHVLDPFAGSGTTLAVATGHGRNATGIDLDERNAELAQQRIGMFLTVEHPPTAA